MRGVHDAHPRGARVAARGCTKTREGLGDAWGCTKTREGLGDAWGCTKTRGGLAPGGMCTAPHVSRLTLSVLETRRECDGHCCEIGVEPVQHAVGNEDSNHFIWVTELGWLR